MFVNISNGNVSCRVSKGAFDNYYKSIGYSIIDDNVSHNTTSDESVKNNDIPSEDTVNDRLNDKEVDSVPNDVDDDNEFVNDILEKPVSQWTNDEMKRFVTIKGIDTSSVKKASEVRNIIKEYLINEEKNKVAEE